MTKKEQEAVYQRLTLMSEENGGDLTPEQVVADAKAKTSPLHGCFVWDDKVAGHKFRLHQARVLIRGLKQTVYTQRFRIEAPVFVRDPQAKAREQGYRTVVSLKEDEAAARAAVVAEAKLTNAHLQRTRALAAAVGLESEVDEILARFAIFCEALEEAA